MHIFKDVRHPRPSFIYTISTGVFEIVHASVLFRGYSGRKLHRNDPSSTHMKGVGPLPVGSYLVQDPISHPRLGDFSFFLAPTFLNDMMGRSGFYIHGDNSKNDASSGCIILGRSARMALSRYLTPMPSKERVLYVQATGDAGAALSQL